jgi:flagellar hook-basal body complex protein FliE
MIDKIGLTTPSPYAGALGAAGQGSGVPGASASGVGGGFADALAQAMNSVDGAQNEATDLAKKFQLGDPKVSLEETMISMQKANVSFQAAVQVRNRLMSAYHDVMNMQV